MADVMNFKCPSCGAVLTYRGSTGTLSCDYCGASFTMEEVKAAEEAEKAAGASSMAWTSTAPTMVQDENGKVSGYVCQSCGAQMVADEHTAATECPYCGNQAVMPQSFAGMYRPDLMIPFAVDKSHAQEALRAFYHGKKLLPASFTAENRIRDINGLYVPFWLMSCHAEGSATFEAVKEERWEDQDFRYVKKDHYRVVRQGGMDFRQIPVDASTKMDDATMDSLEPYDLSKAVAYNPAYFSGYLADRYDVEAKEAEPRANERVKNTFLQKMREAVQGYSEVQQREETLRLSNAKAEYAMLPVWMLTTVYEGQKYVFGMNGQTGKLVGSLPVDKGKYYRYFLLTTLIAAVILEALVFFLGGEAMYAVVAFLVALLIGFLYAQSLKGAMNTIAVQRQATSYLTDGSIRMGRNLDSFLFSRTERMEKPKKA